MEENMIQVDPFAEYKVVQREGWSHFAPLEALTTVAAGHLVNFSKLRPGDRVLDVACGTGVVAVTAARSGARVKGLDLSPVLLERARFNASLANVEVPFLEGDVETLPYEDGEFDVVVSQFGHMFAPRPDVAIREMLRVLRPGGILAFSTWPPELFVGKMFTLVSQYFPPSLVAPPPTTLWGDPNVVRDRLADRVVDVTFERETLLNQTLSPQHFRHLQERGAGPVIKLVENLRNDPARLQKFRTDLESLIAAFMRGNAVKQDFLMTRGRKL